MVVDNLSYELLSPDFAGTLATAIMNVPPNTSSSEKPLEQRMASILLEEHLTKLVLTMPKVKLEVDE
jgi:hypothetical protein